MPAKTQNPILTLRNVRLSYAYIFEAKKPDDPTKKPKYEATAILDTIENKKEIVEAKAAIEILKKSPKFGGKQPSKLCLRKGDDTPERADAEELGPTKWTIGARNTSRPGIVDQQLNPLSQEDGKPYSGCIVNMRVELYPYVFQDKSTTVRGIGASLINIQFVKDGEPFGAKRGPAEEGFESVETAADDPI